MVPLLAPPSFPCSAPQLARTRPISQSSFKKCHLWNVVFCLQFLFCHLFFCCSRETILCVSQMFVWWSSWLRCAPVNHMDCLNLAPHLSEGHYPRGFLCPHVCLRGEERERSLTHGKEFTHRVYTHTHTWMYCAVWTQTRIIRAHKGVQRVSKCIKK